MSLSDHFYQRTIEKWNANNEGKNYEILITVNSIKIKLIWWIDNK